MYCLHCGFCCRKLSPLAVDGVCPRLRQDETFFFCADYENRPDQCYQHKFESEFCPIGMNTLEIKDLQSAYARVKEGYEKLRGL
jgi:hypothetical protein